jgi:hypothetical protein
MTAQEQLTHLQLALQALRSSDAPVGAWIEQARGSAILLEALPPRYIAALNDSLDRLESSALFSEESCSFSQRDLLDGLQLWCDKAQAQLSASA